MKLNKLVSITLCNSFVLLIFASMLASCQKNKFAQTGLFSKWNVKGRSIASVPPISHKSSQPTFINFQDPTQILIFCNLNSSQAKTCYKDHFDKSLTLYIKKFGTIGPDKMLDLKDKFKFNLVQENLNQIIDKVYKKTEPKMDHIVKSRKNFCEKNAQYFLEKCLSQYLEKDTFSVLNQFHGKNRMNGQEYLFIKAQIQKKLNYKLLSAKLIIEERNQGINSTL